MAINDLDINSKVSKEFTVNSFLTNPSGVSGSNAQARTLVLDNIKSKFYSLKQIRKFSHNVFQVNDDIFIKVKVPSESFDNFTYDVIIQFISPDMSSSSILPAKIKFFSNAGSFVYTYAFIFNFFDILIEGLAGKLDKKAINEFPKERNPDAVVFYEKTITMALLYLKENNLLSTMNLKHGLVKLPKAVFFKQACATADEKEEEYKKLQKAESERKKREKEAKKQASNSPKKVITKKDEGKKLAKTSKTGDNKSNKIDNKISTKLDNTKVSNKVNMKI